MYLVVKNHIADAINSGELKSGDQLPSEETLSEQFGVSRSTIRNALFSLERDGIIVRRHGVGTFVMTRKVSLSSRIDAIIPIPELIKDNGFSSSFEELIIDEIKVPNKVATELNISINSKVFSVERLYLANQFPTIFCIDYLPKSIFPNGSIEDMDLKKYDGQMISYMEKELNIHIDHIFTVIKAAGNNDKIALKLKVHPSSPLLLLEQTAYDEKNKPIIFTKGYHRSEIISYHVMRRNI